MTDDAWIRTVRVVRDLGTVQALFPRFVDSMHDLPARLFQAIEVALMVCGWQDNLEPEEVPPKRMWLDGKAAKAWLAEVVDNKRRGAEASGIEDPVQNAAAQGLIVH